MDIAHNRINMAGQKLGKLLVLEPIKRPSTRSLLWRCRCDCGNEVVVWGSSLRNSRRPTKSCGCERIRIVKQKMWKGYEEISKSYWSRLKNGARDRNIEFEITIEYMWDLFLGQSRKCALSGVHLTFSDCIKRKKDLQTASLDRIDPKVGYVVGNVQWVHKKLNALKLNMNNTEFVGWCKLVGNYVQNKSN